MNKEYISYQIDSLTLPSRTNVSVNLDKAVKLSSIEMGGKWSDNNPIDITFKMNGDVVFEYRINGYTDPFKYEFEAIVECDEVVFRSTAVVTRDLPVPFIFYSKPSIKTLILNRNEYKKFDNNGWQTVSTTLPSSEQFQEEGMDELTPLLDRQVTELEPISMEDKTNILFTNGEVGKVFSKTIDLNKYFDIRSIKIEVK